jgi:hypothetical protein
MGHGVLVDGHLAGQLKFAAEGPGAGDRTLDTKLADLLAIEADAFGFLTIVMPRVLIHRVTMFGPVLISLGFMVVPVVLIRVLVSFGVMIVPGMLILIISMFS